MTEGVPFAFEDYFPNLDRYFRFTSVPLGDCFITTGADITSIKKAEEALRQREAELRDAQRVAHVGSWYWDAKTDVTTGSDELLRIYGLDPATQRMPDFREQRGRCYPVEEWERVNAAVQRTIQTGVGYELDIRAIRDGATIWITTRSEVVQDANGQIVGLAAASKTSPIASRPRRRCGEAKRGGMRQSSTLVKAPSSPPRRAKSFIGTLPPG